MAQLLILLMLAVPARCYELVSDQGKASVSQTAKANDAVHDNCPCCPDENKADADNGSCSTCSYCSHYAPLTPQVSVKYNPCVTPLIAREHISRLTDVHLSIFVPPQNLT